MAPRSNETKPHQFRNLTFTDRKPKFLANIDAALRGGQSEETNRSRRRIDDDGQRTEILDPNRPAIPVRPPASDEEDEDGPQVIGSDEIHRLGRLSDDEPDEDAPMVVVVKEGRDLTHEEVEAERIRIRDHPDQPSSLPSSSRPTIQASLTFSSNPTASSSTSKRKVDKLVDGVSRNTQEVVEVDGWSDLVKRTKGNKPPMVSTAKEEREKLKEREVQKKEKKVALKAKNKKAKNLMSFS